MSGSKLKTLAEMVFISEIVNQAKIAERSALRLDACTDDRFDPIEVWAQFNQF